MRAIAMDAISRMEGSFQISVVNFGRLAKAPNERGGGGGGGGRSIRGRAMPAQSSLRLINLFTLSIGNHR